LPAWRRPRAWPAEGDGEEEGRQRLQAPRIVPWLWLPRLHCNSSWHGPMPAAVGWRVESDAGALVLACVTDDGSEPAAAGFTTPDSAELARLRLGSFPLTDEAGAPEDGSEAPGPAARDAPRASGRAASRLGSLDPRALLLRRMGSLHARASPSGAAEVGGGSLGTTPRGAGAQAGRDFGSLLERLRSSK
jgi:hypothetical protein